MVNIREKLSNVKAFVFDIDGVLSLLTINLNPNGIPNRTVNLRDGYAMQLAVKRGYYVGIISGSSATDYIPRLNAFGITDVFLNSKSKIEQYNLFKEKYNLTDAEILYMGDDIPDYEVMKLAGVSACPADAATEIREVATYISFKEGGMGCARDVIEQTMRLHNNWLKSDAFVW